MNHFGEFLECARKTLYISRKEMASFLGWEVESYRLVTAGLWEPNLVTKIILKHIVLDYMREEREISRQAQSRRRNKVDKEKVVKLYLEGFSSQRIAFDQECSVAWINRILSERGFNRERAKKKLSEHDVIRIRRKLLAGEKVKDISEEFQVGTGYIYRIKNYKYFKELKVDAPSTHMVSESI